MSDLKLFEKNVRVRNICEGRAYCRLKSDRV